MNYLEEINQYRQDIEDLDLSPFETLETLHFRSDLKNNYHLLNAEEKQELAKCDIKMIHNAEQILKHLNTIYDSSTSQHPIEDWWWHLDKLVNGEISLTAIPLENDMAL